MATLMFKNAEDAKEAIVASQKKEIAQFYEDWADEIGERAKFYSHKTTASAPLSERYYKELQKQLRATSQEISNEIYKKIKTNIYTVSDAVVKDNVDWLKSFGFSTDGLNAAFSFVPNETVQRLVTGQIYEGGWNLSSRIWGDNEQTLKDVYQVMAKGLAENKPIYDIAKELENYVRPSANLPWNLRTEDGKKIYKKQVDYNAQRLARTLVQHGYQQSFIATTQKNPFITQYRWIANGSRVCELCQARDGQLYDKDKLPMDHPNGMCVMEPVVADDIADQLADWFNSPDGTYPEIDEFAGNFGYEAKVVGTAKDFIDKYGMSTKSPNAWYNSLTHIQKAEAKALKDKSGLTWNEWYEKNIKSTGDPNLDFTKKWGTSNKAPSSWFNSLSVQQKAEAKALKESSGLTWNQWYEKYVYKGGSVSASTKKVVATKKVVTAQANDATAIVFNQSQWDDMIRAQRDRSYLMKLRGWEADWEYKLPLDQKNAVHLYTKEGPNCYRQQNGYLRFNQDVSGAVKKTVGKIKKALDKSITTEDMMLVRGTSTGLYTDIFTGELKTALDTGNVAAMTGQVFRDPGFLSTSPNGDEFGGNLQFKIFAPAGTKGGYVERNNYFGEKEFLLQSNTSYYIEKAEKDVNDNIIMYLRILV